MALRAKWLQWEKNIFFFENLDSFGTHRQALKCQERFAKLLKSLFGAGAKPAPKSEKNMETEEIISIPRQETNESPEDKKVAIIDADKLPLLTQLMLLSMAGQIPQNQEENKRGEHRLLSPFESPEDEKARKKQELKLEMRRNRKAKKKRK